MLLWAMLAMVLVAAAPAVAQLGQEFSEEDVESGDVEPSIGIASKGDQVNLCANVLQSAQSGNLQNQQGLLQYKSFPDEIEFEGSTIEVTPELANECTQVIEQAAAAGAKGEAKAGTGTAEAKVGSPAEASAGSGGAGGGGSAGGGAKELPKTGGIADIAPLLGIGAGALLMAGGLIARRIIR